MTAVALLAGCASARHGAPPTSASAPAPAAQASCPAGQTRGVNVELVFGRNVAGKGEVTDAAWKQFIDEDVTPRYPDGFSVLDVQGQWRASNGQIVREPSKVLFLVLDGGPDDPAKIAHIRDAYKRRFQQEAVLMVTHPVCYGF